MNKTALFLLLFLTFTGIQKTKTNGFTVSTILSTLQATKNTIASFAPQVTRTEYAGCTKELNQNGLYTYSCSFTKDDETILSYLQIVYDSIMLCMDMFSQKTISSNYGHMGEQSGYLSMINQLWDIVNRSPGTIQQDLIYFYQSAQGIPNFTIPAGTNLTSLHIQGNNFIGCYSNQTLQYLSKLLIDLANNTANLSQAMSDAIIANSNAITNNTKIDPSQNPLNANIFQEQVAQDFTFIINNILIYMANLLTNTPNAATILYSPQVSCSDAIANSIMTVLNPPAGTSQDTTISNVLEGNTTNSLPAAPTKIAITQITIYAAICAFVLAYDANSTSGPYQSEITGLISINNIIQSW